MAVLNTTAVTQTANVTSSSMVAVVNWIIGIFIICSLFYLLWWFISFRKLRVQIDIETDTGIQILKNTKAKEKKSRDGVMKWHFMYKRIRTDAPPKNCVLLDSKGRKVARCLYKDGAVIWLTQEHLLDDESISSISYKPFKGETKSAMAYEFREAESYRRKRLSELLMNMAPLLGLIIILVVFLIFVPRTVEEVTGLLLSTQEVNQETMRLQMQLMDKYDALLNNRQILVGQNTTGGGVPN